MKKPNAKNEVTGAESKNTSSKDMGETVRIDNVDHSSLPGSAKKTENHGSDYWDETTSAVYTEDNAVSWVDSNGSMDLKRAIDRPAIQRPLRPKKETHQQDSSIKHRSNHKSNHESKNESKNELFHRSDYTNKLLRVDESMDKRISRPNDSGSRKDLDHINFSHRSNSTHKSSRNSSEGNNNSNKLFPRDDESNKMRTAQASHHTSSQDLISSRLNQMSHKPVDRPESPYACKSRNELFGSMLLLRVDNSKIESNGRQNYSRLDGNKKCEMLSGNEKSRHASRYEEEKKRLHSSFDRSSTRAQASQYSSRTTLNPLASRAPSVLKSSYDEEMASRQTRIETLSRVERLAQDKWAKDKLSGNAACPENFNWHRIPGGYRCRDGGSTHIVTDALLSEGKGGLMRVFHPIPNFNEMPADAMGPYYLDSNGNVYLYAGPLPAPIRPDFLVAFLHGKAAARELAYQLERYNRGAQLNALAHMLDQVSVEGRRYLIKNFPSLGVCGGTDEDGQAPGQGGPFGQVSPF